MYRIEETLVLSRSFCGYDLKNNVSFKKISALVQNILDVCCLSETKTFELFSDFLAFILSSKNSHQLMFAACQKQKHLSFFLIF